MMWPNMSLPLYGVSLVHEMIRENLPIYREDVLLEVGVGTGFSALQFAEKSKKIIGIDISQPTIELLNSLYSEIPNITFLCFDICDRGFSEEYRGVFDKVYSGDTLEHVQDPRLFIWVISQVLKPGGQAVITFPNTIGHGITFFSKKKELIHLFTGTDLLTEISHLRMRKPGKILHRILWGYHLGLFRKLRKGSPSGDPQQFHETWLYANLHSSKRIYFLVNCYSMFVTKLLRLWEPLFSKCELDAEEKIINKRILIVAKKLG